jgi:hypothetical protein
MDDDDPFGSYGLRPVQLGDKSVFDRFLSCCAPRLSDYTFANTFIWREPIHLRWAVLEDCLCVFANGDGGLTLLFPPMGGGDAAAALGRCLEICEDYNAAHRFDGWTRVEYVSSEMLQRLGGGAGFDVRPMSGDYVYLTERMIDLAGGDLASKRQARNRFARRYEARTEPYGPRHREACLRLLALWQGQVEQSAGEAGGGAADRRSVAVKRNKDVVAAREALVHCEALALKGLVLYAGDAMVGFTLGEMLDEATCSILIEKTDRQYAGSAQYIFSEFCRQFWPHARWCNVGDDWEVPSLAWTKESYRPAMRLEKFLLRPMRAPVRVPAAVAPSRAAGLDGAPNRYSSRLGNPPRRAESQPRRAESEGETPATRRRRLAEPFVVVEGVGGLLCPITNDFWVIHLARMMALPLVVVARAGLGTINHTLLTLHAVRSAGLAVAGVVLNRYLIDPLVARDKTLEELHQRGDVDMAMFTNPRQVESRGRVKVLALVPEDKDSSVEDARIGPDVQFAVDQADWERLAEGPDRP